jgi:ubiquinone/menaquinone biosynthesis C-methylase UbiE
MKGCLRPRGGFGAWFDGYDPRRQRRQGRRCQQVRVDDFTPFDEALRARLEGGRSPVGGSLLAQTLATGPARRQLLSSLPLRKGWRVLDLGTGFGPVGLELARMEEIDVVGVDLDEALLRAARSLACSLAGFVQPGSSVRFVRADATLLGFERACFDLVTARLVFQHLAQPSRAAEEIARVLRPGGYAFVFDVDDGLGATFPPLEGPLALLEDAFSAFQASYGGDRMIGRKLSSILAAAGLRIEQVAVLSQAEHRRSEPGDAERAMTSARLRAARAGIVADGILPAEEFDQLLAAYESAAGFERCRIECQVAVLARRPGGAAQPRQGAGSATEDPPRL